MFNQKSILKKCLTFSVLVWIGEALFLVASFLLVFVAEPVADSGYWVSKQRVGEIIGIIGILISAPGILAISKNIIFIIADLWSGQTMESEIYLHDVWKINLPTCSYLIVESPKRLFLPIPGSNYWFYLFSHSYYIISSELISGKTCKTMMKGDSPPKKIVATKWAHIVLTIG